MKGRLSTVSGGRRAVMILGLTVLLLLLFAGGYVFLAPIFERDRGETVAGSADWMASLPDDARLNELSIPGTHDSAAAYVEMAYFAKCQSKPILKQLEAGFRYLDIRLAVDKDKLILTHGSMRCKKGNQIFSTNLYLEDVLDECRSFLREHPGETVLFAVKQEDGSESVKEFQQMLHRYINTAPSVWLLTDRFPTLEEARGKLVLLRRYEDEAGFGEESGIPLIWKDQGNKENTELNTAEEPNGSYTLWVQDRYKYQSDEKWAAFREGIKNAEYNENTAVLNFLSTSGNGKVGHPYGYAKDLNKRLLMYQGLPDKTGWVILDFGTAPLAAMIYAQNSGPVLQGN